MPGSARSAVEVGVPAAALAHAEEQPQRRARARRSAPATGTAGARRARRSLPRNCCCRQASSSGPRAFERRGVRRRTTRAGPNTARGCSRAPAATSRAAPAARCRARRRRAARAVPARSSTDSSPTFSVCEPLVVGDLERVPHEVANRGQHARHDVGVLRPAVPGAVRCCSSKPGRPVDQEHLLDAVDQRVQQDDLGERLAGAPRVEPPLQRRATTGCARACG